MNRLVKINSILKHIFSPETFLWFYPLILILPNIALDFTEAYSVVSKICNVFLPLGTYLIIMSLWKNVGRTGSLLLFPVLFYGAFQIVLLFLYGESIIAVDMLLNVATTNVEEASELLGNLASAMITICLVYVPVLTWGIIIAVKKKFAPERNRMFARKAGCVSAFVGVVSLILAYGLNAGFSMSREIFPVNVIRNTITATERTANTEKYYETSKGFSYHAVSDRPEDEKEIYVVVVGETSRAGNWQLFGYDRPTNPQLSKRRDIVAFPKALSESNTTHKSVPMMLSWLSADNFGDSIYSTKSIITTFKESGFATAYLSNQAHNHSFIDFFAEEADEVNFLKDDNKNHIDLELLNPVKEFLSSNHAKKKFLVLHTYGSHFNYIDRYKQDASVFKPDDAALAEQSNRKQLINAYDNTIIQTDKLLDEIMDLLESEDCCSALMYASDHGEDIFDDDRERFLHASPVPTYYQVHVPMLAWMSTKYREKYPEYFSAAAQNKDKEISSSNTLFNTMLHIAGITTPYMNRSQVLTDTVFTGSPRVYVNDYNEKVDLTKVGFRKNDFLQFENRGIAVE